MKKVILMMFLFVLLLSGCNRNEDKIIILTSSGYEPYEMLSDQDKLIGFDIELMELLAKEVGIEIEWRDVEFDEIFDELEAGNAEIAIAAISPTEERKELVDFSDVYYNSESGISNFIIYKNNQAITGFNDLDGSIVGVQSGTIQADALYGVVSIYNITLELRDSYPNLVSALLNNQVDAIVAEKELAEVIVEENSSLDMVGFASRLDDIMGNAIAFSKDSEYVELFNEALQTLKDNGELDRLITKWFN